MITIVQKLRMARGTNRKLAILHQEKDNEGWKKLLLAMYDSSINYYVSAPNDTTFITDEINADELLDHLSWLSTRTVTGNEARVHALEGSRKYGEMYRLILGGSVKAGVSITTINKAYPGLIPTFDVMLAKDVQDVRYPLLASLKYDGVRVLAHVESHPTSDNRVTLYTRAGKTIPIRSLESQMAAQPGGWYDGELVDGDGLQVGRTKITGSVNKCLKGTATDIDGYSFAIFDWISEQEWEDKVCETPYITRLRFMIDNFKPTKNAKVALQHAVYNDNEVNDKYSTAIKYGYEGLILRSQEDPYIWKRSDKLIKKKAIHDIALKCIGTIEGTGKYEGLIGSLVCEGIKMSPSGIIEGIKVNVGSGLTDMDREIPHHYYIGKEVEVLYNDIVRAEGADHYSLFLPRFKRIVGDYNQ